jgi:hypothetical protein
VTLAQLLRMPDPTDTFEQAERYYGVDLQRYSIDELGLEAERIRLALLMTDDRTPARKQELIAWLLQRLELVRTRLP